MKEFDINEAADDVLAAHGAVRGYNRAVLVIANTLFFAALVLIGFIFVGSFDFFVRRIEFVLALGGIAAWRWGWFVTQALRALAYRYIVYPRLRRKARKMVARTGGVPQVIVLATTYKEKPWITNIVFRSVYEELGTIEGLERPPVIVLATGCDEDDIAMREVHERFAKEGASGFVPELILVRGDQGKRKAIGSALHEVQGMNPDENGVIIFMDGDSLFRPGVMNSILPLFRLKPEVDAVTTNEDGYVAGPKWFAEWISLRFGLRHRTMCSLSLSGKLLCLTGRMSAFRTGVTMNESFIQQVHNDMLDHWLWGRFEMLSGDDKSTWYWLAKNGSRMLYAPDAMVTTIEVVENQGLRRAYENIKRWSGNTIRNSARVIKLGPKKLGWFLWWSVLDQRISMFTVLFGPTMALVALVVGDFHMAFCYLAWVLLSRLVHSSISWFHGRRVSVIYLPIQVISEWVMAATKIWVLFHPANQRWFNRGNRKLDTSNGSAFFAVRKYSAHYLFAFSLMVLGWSVAHLTHLVSIPRESSLYRSANQDYSMGAKEEVVFGSPTGEMISDTNRENHEPYSRDGSMFGYPLVTDEKFSKTSFNEQQDSLAAIPFGSVATVSGPSSIRTQASFFGPRDDDSAK